MRRSRRRTVPRRAGRSCVDLTILRLSGGRRPGNNYRASLLSGPTPPAGKYRPGGSIGRCGGRIASSTGAVRAGDGRLEVAPVRRGRSSFSTRPLPAPLVEQLGTLTFVIPSRVPAWRAAHRRYGGAAGRGEGGGTGAEASLVLALFFLRANMKGQGWQRHETTTVPL